MFFTNSNIICDFLILPWYGREPLAAQVDVFWERENGHFFFATFVTRITIRSYTHFHHFVFRTDSEPLGFASLLVLTNGDD